MLENIRSAFEGDSVPKKNAALRKAHDEIVRLRGVLNDAQKPLGHHGREADKEGPAFNA